MSTVIKETNVVEVESTLEATVDVTIEDGYVTHIRIGYPASSVASLSLEHDNSMLALIQLRDQINEVIEECKKFARQVPRNALREGSSIFGIPRGK